MRNRIAKGKLTPDDKRLLTALSKAPKFSGTVYRGEVLDSIKHLTPGKFLWSESLISTSESASVASKAITYARKEMGIQHRYEVVYVIRGVKEGRRINEFIIDGRRPYKAEKEVVMQKGVKMKVVTVSLGTPDKQGRQPVKVTLKVVKE
jgi:hypothetical protein